MTERPPANLTAVVQTGDTAAISAALADLEAGEGTPDAATAAACRSLLPSPVKAICRRAAGILARAVASGDAGVRASLLAAMTSEDPRERWGSCFALARGGVLGPEVLQGAVATLGASDGDVRWAAAEVVRAAVRLEPRLLEVVRAAAHDESVAARGRAERRKMAIYCLRDLRDLDPTFEAAVFVEALDDSDRGVRLAALSAIGAVAVAEGVIAGDGIDVIARLARCIESDDDIGVRRACAATLGKLCGRFERATEVLEKIEAASSDPDLLRAVRSALS
jgi:HEAT repeat protein